MIACCGLDCSKCEAYLATQEDNDVKRALGSHKNNFNPGFRPALPDPQLQNPRNSSLFLWF